MVGLDFIRFFEEFYRDGIINKRLKNSFIKLIPKREGLVELLHYWHTSLVGSIYKLVAEVLADRLKKVLPEIIGELQGAFVDDRQILDEVPITNELVHSRKRDKKPGLLFKIEMEKA